MNLECQGTNAYSLEVQLPSVQLMMSFEKLMKGLKRQQDSPFMPTIDKEKAMFSSFIVSQKIVEKCKPFSVGEFVQECMVACAMELCPKEKQKFEDVSLSRQTVTRRIVDMADDSREQLKIVSKNFEYFSLALDESTDITDRYITAFDLCSWSKC